MAACKCSRLNNANCTAMRGHARAWRVVIDWSVLQPATGPGVFSFLIASVRSGDEPNLRRHLISLRGRDTQACNALALKPFVQLCTLRSAGCTACELNLAARKLICSGPGQGQFGCRSQPRCVTSALRGVAAHLHCAQVSESKVLTA